MDIFWEAGTLLFETPKVYSKGEVRHPFESFWKHFPVFREMMKMMKNGVFLCTPPYDLHFWSFEKQWPCFSNGQIDQNHKYVNLDLFWRILMKNTKKWSRFTNMWKWSFWPFEKQWPCSSKWQKWNRRGGVHKNMYILMEFEYFLKTGKMMKMMKNGVFCAFPPMNTLFRCFEKQSHCSSKDIHQDSHLVNPDNILQ